MLAFIPCTYIFLAGYGLAGQLCVVTNFLLSWLCSKDDDPVAQVLIVLELLERRRKTCWGATQEAGKQGLPVTGDGMV